MKFYVPAKNIRVFARSIVSCIKFSEQIVFKCKDDGLLIQAIESNASSAFSVFFHKGFFGTFDTCTNQYVLLSRFLYLAFRSPNSLDKKQANCLMILNSLNDDAIIRFEMKNNLAKAYTINYVDNDVTLSEWINRPFSNHLSITVRQLMECLTHFSMDIKGVVLTIETDHIQFENVGENIRLTKVKLKPSNFDKFIVQNPISIYFSLKKLKMFFSFIEQKNQTLNICIDDDKEPIYFEVLCDKYKSLLALETLNIDRSTKPSSRNNSINLNTGSVNFPTQNRKPREEEQPIIDQAIFDEDTRSPIPQEMNEDNDDNADNANDFDNNTNDDVGSDYGISISDIIERINEFDENTNDKFSTQEQLKFVNFDLFGDDSDQEDSDF